MANQQEQPAATTSDDLKPAKATRKKTTRRAPAAKKVAAKKTTAKKTTAKKPAAKKAATRKPATRAKKTATKTTARASRAKTATAKAKRATTARKKAAPRASKPKAARSATAAKRTRKPKSVVIAVPPIMINTAAAAAAAATLVASHAQPFAAASGEAPRPVVEQPGRAKSPAALSAPGAHGPHESFAFRLAKQAAANPVDKQLAGFLGGPTVVRGLLPAPYRNDRSPGGPKLESTNPHSGHFGVPRRQAG